MRAGAVGLLVLITMLVQINQSEVSEEDSNIMTPLDQERTEFRHLDSNLASSAEDNAKADFHTKSSEHDKPHYNPKHFDYSKNHGPAHWPKMFHLCGGRSQSPVKLDTTTAVTQHQPRILWWNYFLKPRAMTLSNNGHTVVLTAKWLREEYKPYHWSPPGKAEYVFDQLHFHWGMDDRTGSEHTLNNERFALEMHAVHHLRQYKTLEHAGKQPEGIRVIGFFFRISDREHHNTGLQQIVDLLQAVRPADTSILIKEPFPISRLVQEFSSQYFTYNGSLTTPPCAETVSWVIRKEPLTVSRHQAEGFRNLLDHNGHIIKLNYRPVQSLNDTHQYLKWKKQCARQIYSMTESSGPFWSPIDLNIRDMKPIVEMPALKWFNYDQPPVKMKLTNSGHTVIVSGKWGQKRPYVGEGPLPENGYVFSQMHFHWGEYNNEGSEHTVEGKRWPMEMHVMHFKSSYKTQEAALKEKDGIIAMVYFFKIQSQPNPNLKNIVRSLEFIHDPQISARIRPEPLSKVIIPFQQDYFLYWGSINTTTCSHLILWFICRQPIGISTEQVAKFRSIIDITSIPMMKNYRKIQQAKDTVVFHVLPSNKVSTTLLPIQESNSYQLPRRDQQEKRNSNSLHKESGQSYETKIPPRMVPREILVQPTGLNFKQPFIYPGTSGQYLQPTSPIPVFVPVLNSGLTPNYKNMYGYAPMMFPYPIEQHTLLRGKNTRETYSNENDSSESDLQSAGKSKHYKNSKKIETGSTMNNKIASIEKRKEMEQKAASSKKNKSSRESKQTFSSKQDQTLSNVNNTELPYELRKFGNPGFTSRDTDKSKDWTFVTPFKQMTLPTSCDEGKKFGS